MTCTLRSIQLFKGLTAAELETVGRQLTEKRFKAGETILSHGDSCLKVMFVLSGRVRVKPGSSCGKEQSIDTLQTGDACVCHPNGENLRGVVHAETSIFELSPKKPRDLQGPQSSSGRQAERHFAFGRRPGAQRLQSAADPTSAQDRRAGCGSERSVDGLRIPGRDRPRDRRRPRNRRPSAQLSSAVEAHLDRTPQNLSYRPTGAAKTYLNFSY